MQRERGRSFPTCLKFSHIGPDKNFFKCSNERVDKLQKIAAVSSKNAN